MLNRKLASLNSLRWIVRLLEVLNSDLKSNIVTMANISGAQNVCGDPSRQLTESSQ